DFCCHRSMSRIRRWPEGRCTYPHMKASQSPPTRSDHAMSHACTTTYSCSRENGGRQNGTNDSVGIFNGSSTVDENSDASSERGSVRISWLYISAPVSFRFAFRHRGASGHVLHGRS